MCSITNTSFLGQVLFEAGTNQAIGVKFERFGKIETARANKEVILSAGAIGTPKILLLSGIGPEQELNTLQVHLQICGNLWYL